MVILFWTTEYSQYDKKPRLTVMYGTSKIIPGMAMSAEIHTIHNDEALNTAVCYAYYLQRVWPIQKLNEFKTTVMFNSCS